MTAADGVPSTSAELDTLLATLGSLRASVLDKLAGLSEEDARRSTVPSGTNLAGLVQHLTFVESKWFEQIVAGGRASRGKRSMQSTRPFPCRRCARIIALPATRGTTSYDVSQIRRRRWCTAARSVTSERRSSPSSTRRPGMPGMPTSSANRSTAEPALTPLTKGAEKRGALSAPCLGA